MRESSEVLERYREYLREFSNPMRAIKIEKVVINCSVGASGEKLEKAMKILERLTGQKPAVRRAKRTIKNFGISRGMPMATIVTLRGDKALLFLDRVLEAVDRRIRYRAVGNGNFSFGLSEHIDIPGVKYDPELGIIGFDVHVKLERPGYRVERRRRARSKVGSKHRISKEETIEFLKKVLRVELERIFRYAFKHRRLERKKVVLLGGYSYEEDHRFAPYSRYTLTRGAYNTSRRDSRICLRGSIGIRLSVLSHL